MIKGVEFLYTVSNITKLQEFLDQNKDMDIASLRDQKKNSVLHNAAYNNRLQIMKIMVDHIKKLCESNYWKNNSVYKKPVKQQIQALINQGNSQGYTCLHYACYRGNVQMIEWLQSLGGNIMCTTKTGLNLLHSAAQGDKVAPFLYLNKKLEINTVDYRNSTVLHEACKNGSESVVEFILAQPNIQIDSFNSENETSLHIAVQNGRTKIVKMLCIKGADRTLANGQGQKPIEIAKNLQFSRIAHILNNNYRFRDYLKFYFNVKVKYQPQKRTFGRTILFALAFIFVAVVSHLLIIPKFSIYIIYALGALNFLLIVIFLILLIQPQTPESKQYKNLINSIPICPTCRIPKRDRMHHCDICKVCVPQYDHHCPWINGCVGKHNIRLFVTFLSLLVILMLENALLDVVGIFKLQFMFQQYRLFGASESSTDILNIEYRLILSVSLFLIAVFFLPITILLYYQITNLFYNLTTFQRFSKPQKRARNRQEGSQYSQSQKQSFLQNPDTQECSFKNCGIMCSQQVDQKPSVMDEQ